MYLSLSIRVREVKEVSKSGRQLEKVERKWSKAGHNITKWNSVSTASDEHNLQDRRWYGGFGALYRPVSMWCRRQPPRRAAMTHRWPLHRMRTSSLVPKPITTVIGLGTRLVQAWYCARWPARLEPSLPVVVGKAHGHHVDKVLHSAANL